MNLTYRFALALLACAGLNGIAVADDAVPPAPDALKVPPGHALKVSVKASGFQIYECGADKTNPAAFVWNFSAPQADLFDAQGKKLGKHYAGPTWEGEDGSKIVGQVKASDKGTDAGAISWLLLEAKANSGDGIFSHISHVQRLATSGGKAPAEGCDATTKGAISKVPYTAQYYFYEAAR